ncbi:DUF1559 domain-containing protein [Rhodopirellula sallentina]|uniref:Secreted protein containing DUF1559 n=1 Tax=Rhodopirellula sallentina SM41 TaxID=1263870 RepID=M5U1P6_9BACT|nr:DUF1559 domain-containing protein [Rhodopirellula sallentina]EMI55360.1 secreted protein containing DUF1559 [Rhodopirellula sallentina SM41]
MNRAFFLHINEASVASSFRILAIAIAVLSSSLIAAPGFAQDALAPTKTSSDNGSLSRYVPDDALAVAILSPENWLNNSMLEMFPIEVVRVQMIEQTGIDPMDIAEIKIVVSLDPQTMQPEFGAITQFTDSIRFERLREALDASPESMPVGSHEGYAVEGPPGTIVSMIDDTTLYVGMAGYLQKMLDAENGNGDLPFLLRSMSHSSGLTIAMVTEQVRPILSGVAMQNASELAPDLQPLAQVPGLTDAIKIHIDFNDESAAVRVALKGTDEVAAQRIESILADSIVATRVLAIEEVSRNLAESEQSRAMREAIDRYANRIADKITKALQPTLRGDEVALEMEPELSVATTGVLVGLLLPAVQAARTAARRMSSSNNFKQVMLAFHNYHSAYRRLPAPAITDADGKPLLSWRVALLPFLEEQQLYQQFHLDEPWDSEHNLPLSKKLPSVYESPGVPLPPGRTMIQAIVGEKIGMHPEKKTSFRDFLDGLSNSILIVETNPDAAVVWSKPEDIEIDLDRPLRNLGNARDGGFHVGMGDGAVRFALRGIDPDLFTKLLTRSGKEVVDHNDW